MSEKGSRPRNIREKNTKLILNLYRENKFLSVSQIAKLIHLSRTTALKINDYLLENSLILPLGKGASTDEGGKKPNLYSINPNHGVFLSVHIEYQSVSMALFDFSMNIIDKRKVDFLENSNLDLIIEIISIYYGNSIKTNNILSIVVAIHGTVNSDTGNCLYSAKFPSWGSPSIIRMINEKVVRDIPIYLDNWINYRAFSERKKIKNNLSTFTLLNAGHHGVSAGIIMDGKLYPGSHYIAGEIGHIKVDPHDSFVCQCGGTGCLESVTDYKRVIAEAALRKKEFPNSLIFTENNITLSSIIAAFKKKDPLAIELLTTVAKWLGIGLSNLSMIIDPDLIIFEGDYASAGEEFIKLISYTLKNSSMLRISDKPEIKLNIINPESTLTGAAEYAIEKYIEDITI